MIVRKIVFCLLLVQAVWAGANDHLEIKYGVLKQSTVLKDYEAARVTLSLWLEDVFKAHNYKVSLKFFDQSKSIYNAFMKKNALDMVIIDLETFFKNKKSIDHKANLFWTTAFDKYTFKTFYLISKANAKDMTGVKGKSIALSSRDKGAFVWADKQSLIHNKQPLKKAASAIEYFKEDSKALLKVFFAKSDFAVVTALTWDTMVELNPAIAKQLKIVKKSHEVHVPYVGFFNKDVPVQTTTTFFELSGQLHELPRSEQIMTMLKFNRIIKLNAQDLGYLEKYYNEYYELKSKYK